MVSETITFDILPLVSVHQMYMQVVIGLSEWLLTITGPSIWQNKHISWPLPSNQSIIASYKRGVGWS